MYDERDQDMACSVRTTVVSLCCIMAILCCGARTEDNPKTTRTVLKKFSDDLLKAWKDYPSDKQKIAREQHINDLNTAITKEINSAEIPPDLTLNKVLINYMEQLDESRLSFRLEKMSSTRQMYVTALGLGFKREISKATDYAAARTTQQAYDLLLQWMVMAKDKMRLSPPDAQTQVYTAITALFTDLLRTATVPENTDHTAALDENIKEARRRFPTSSETLSKVNSPIVTVLESKAKEVQQKAVKR
jgi:hypothetical protein